MPHAGASAVAKQRAVDEGVTKFDLAYRPSAPYPRRYAAFEVVTAIAPVERPWNPPRNTMTAFRRVT